MFQTVIEYTTTNAAALVGVLLAAHALALTIVNLTPTPKDDEVLAKVYSVIEWVAGIVTPKAKT